MATRSFRKSERLGSRKTITNLFEKGRSLSSFPLRVYWLINDAPGNPKHQVMISVPKRNFPLAVHRNLMKRRMREAYRLEKGRLPAHPHIFLAILLTARDLLDFDAVRKGMVAVLDRLRKVPGGER